MSNVHKVRLPPRDALLISPDTRFVCITCGEYIDKGEQFLNDLNNGESRHQFECPSAMPSVVIEAFDAFGDGPVVQGGQQSLPFDSGLRAVHDINERESA